MSQDDRYWRQSNANPERRRARLEAAIPEDRSGCWTWAGTKIRAGYGVMRGGSKAKVYVHRAAYEMWRGPIPEGMMIDHLCRNRACFNPDHLEVVTNAENTRRGIVSLRADSAREVCKRGHPKTPENIYESPDGRTRRCRPCNLDWQAERRQRRREASRARLGRGRVG